MVFVDDSHQIGCAYLTVVIGVGLHDRLSVYFSD